MTLALQHRIGRRLHVRQRPGIHFPAENARRKLVLLTDDTANRIRITT